MYDGNGEVERNHLGTTRAEEEENVNGCLFQRLFVRPIGDDGASFVGFFFITVAVRGKRKPCRVTVVVLKAKVVLELITENTNTNKNNNDQTVTPLLLMMKTN
mmetsp:Transcript_22796/g.34502  ORF Transcript_22796/g.34502 Transcript_22796/m.34502 type:complete len:103 (-) Transcript_22796:125-433(-)